MWPFSCAHPLLVARPADFWSRNNCADVKWQRTGKQVKGWEARVLVFSLLCLHYLPTKGPGKYSFCFPPFFLSGKVIPSHSLLLASFCPSLQYWEEILPRTLAPERQVSVGTAFHFPPPRQFPSLPWNFSSPPPKLSSSALHFRIPLTSLTAAQEKRKKRKETGQCTAQLSSPDHRLPLPGEGLSSTRFYPYHGPRHSGSTEAQVGRGQLHISPLEAQFCAKVVRHKEARQRVHLMDL